MLGVVVCVHEDFNGKNSGGQPRSPESLGVKTLKSISAISRAIIHLPNIQRQIIYSANFQKHIFPKMYSPPPPVYQMIDALHAPPPPPQYIKLMPYI